MSIEQENNEMLRNQIKEVAHHSREIKDVVTKRTRVEPWVVAKMERASSDLSDVTHYLDGERYADGGGLYDYKIGDFAWIRKADYNEMCGEIIDIRNFEMNVNLGQDIKGSQSEIYATIVDENGKEHSGQLMPKNYADGGSLYADGGMVKKDRYGKDVKIGDAIHIRVLAGRYGQTKDYEGIVTGFDKFGNVELDGQRSVLYTADYTNNDYEHGHHIWVEKINPKDIKDSLRVPKKFISTFSGEIDGKEFAIKGEDEFKEWAEKNYPGSTFGQWNPLYNKGWKYVNGEYISPDGIAHKSVNVYQSVEQGQGYLLNLFIPTGKAKKLPKPQKDILKIGDVLLNEDNREISLRYIYGDGMTYLFNTLESPGIGNDGWGKKYSLSEVQQKLKSKEWTRITKDYADGGSTYADRGGVEDVVVLQDRKYPITYTVKPIGNSWLVVSSSPNWEEDQEMVFISKEDALNHAKIEAGYMNEFDPESSFMRSNERFAKGGKVGVGMMAWRGSEAYNVIGYDDSVDRWIFKSTTSGLEYRPKQDELNEFEFIKPKKMADGGGVSSEKTEKIAKLEKVLSSTLVPDSVKEKARLEIEKLKSEGSSSSKGISAEQRDLNKKALVIVEKAKITNYVGLVAEALQDANYSSEGFKFAQLIDSSIKTKEDWYQAEDFVGDDKTRDAAIEITQMCGWDGDKITEALYFVLKMNGQHRIADAVKKAMTVEEANYPNAITELTKQQTEWTQEIATRTGLRQSAVADFVAKNGLSESETLAIVSGLGRKQISASDVMTAVVGTPNNEYEQKIVAFAKSGEGFKSSEPKSIRSVVEDSSQDNQIQEMIDQSNKWEQEVSEALDVYAKPKNPEQEKSANAKLREIEGLRYARNKNLYLFENKPKDEKKDEVHDAILDADETDMPKGYNAVVIDSYYDVIMGQNNTVVAVKNPNNDIFYLNVYTYKKLPIGKTFGDDPKAFFNVTKIESETKPSIRTAVVEVEKEQPKVSDDRLKGKHISDVSQYIAHRNIESITFKHEGKSVTVKGSQIFDGIYVDNKALGIKSKRTPKAKQPKVTRTQFEEESFEYGTGGYVRPKGKTTGVYEFAVKGGIYEVMVVGFERQNDTEDALYFDDSNEKQKKELGSILVKNKSWNKISKGQTVMAHSTSGIKGKLTRVKDLY